MNVGKRFEAKARGERFYFTGVPCKNGHIAFRMTGDGHCLECNKTRREFRKSSPSYREKDRVRARGRWKKGVTAEKMKIALAKWRAENPEAARAADRERARRWREANPQRATGVRVRWEASNREKVLAKRALRRAREFNAAVDLTEEEKAAVREIYRKRDLMTRLTGEQYHVDHRLALARGGKHHPSNLQLLPALENLRKGAK